MGRCTSAPSGTHSSTQQSTRRHTPRKFDVTFFQIYACRGHDRSRVREEAPRMSLKSRAVSRRKFSRLLGRPKQLRSTSRATSLAYVHFPSSYSKMSWLTPSAQEPYFAPLPPFQKEKKELSSSFPIGPGHKAQAKHSSSKFRCKALCPSLSNVENNGNMS